MPQIGKLLHQQASLVRPNHIQYGRYAYNNMMSMNGSIMGGYPMMNDTMMFGNGQPSYTLESYSKPTNGFLNNLAAFMTGLTGTNIGSYKHETTVVNPGGYYAGTYGGFTPNYGVSQQQKADTKKELDEIKKQYTEEAKTLNDMHSSRGYKVVVQNGKFYATNTKTGEQITASSFEKMNDELKEKPILAETKTTPSTTDTTKTTT